MPQLRLHVDDGREDEIPRTLPFPSDAVGRPSRTDELIRGVEAELARMDERLRDIAEELDAPESLPFPSASDEDDNGPRAA